MSNSRNSEIAVLTDDATRAEELAPILRAVAHPLRLRLIACLARGEDHVSALAERVGAAQGVVSHQLGILRMNRLVAVDRREGKAFYRISEPHLHDLLHCVAGCRPH